MVAAVWPNAVEELTSSGTFADGQWHNVVVTLGASGYYMYVDGALQASNPSVTSAQAYNGYWHMGWGGNELTSWPDSPSNAWFPGSLAGVAVLSSQLSPSAAEALDNGTTYDAQVFSYSPSEFWNWGIPNVCGFIGLSMNGGSSESLAALVGASSSSSAVGVGDSNTETNTETAISGAPSFEAGLVAFGTQAVVAAVSGSKWSVELEHPFVTTLGST